MTDLDDQSVADLRKQMQLLQQTIDKKSKTLKTDDKEFVVDGTQQSQAHTRTLSVSKNNDGSSPVTKTSTVVGNDKHALLDSASKHMGHHTFAEEVKQTMIIGTPSKKEQKKQQKQARKVAMWLEKHELHPCKKWGVVAAKDRIIVPDYAVNAGTDIKWEADPCDIDLKGILTPEEYFTVISTINEAVSHARAKPIDLALAVASGFLLFPIIAWGIRHRKHRTKHKKILIEQLRRFNQEYLERGIRMRWRRKPDSQLVIERNVHT